MWRLLLGDLGSYRQSTFGYNLKYLLSLLHIHLTSLLLSSLISLYLLYPKTRGNKCSHPKYPSLLSHCPPIYHGFWHQRIQTTYSHVSHCHHYNYCHYCNVDFVLFHNITCFTNYLLSSIHVSTIYLLNITCTLVSKSVVLWMLECNRIFTSCVKYCINFIDHHGPQGVTHIYFNYLMPCLVDDVKLNPSKMSCFFN